ncbi:MAG: hypothetical protein DMF06_04970 [Verrucomicrobia bacterium]|nr:MAG: hypothetical protein DMF06_04970 [Verrucomicrobiota bacterium]
MKLVHYRLLPDHSVEPVDVSSTERLMSWAQEWGGMDKRVAFTEVAPGITVSTVFLGIDHSFMRHGPPLLFETMVFDDYGSNDCWRYATWDDAAAGHESVVKGLERSIAKLPKKVIQTP